MQNVVDPPARISDHFVRDLLGIAQWHCLGGDLVHIGCSGVVPWLLGSFLWELVYDGTLLMAMWIKRFKNSLGTHTGCL